MANLTELSAMLGNAIEESGPLSKGHMTYVSGQRVIELRDQTGDGAVDVAVQGKPYPMLTMVNGVPRSEALSFDQWNHPVVLERPSNVIDIEKLKARA